MKNAITKTLLSTVLLTSLVTLAPEDVSAQTVDEQIQALELRQVEIAKEEAATQDMLSALDAEIEANKDKVESFKSKLEEAQNEMKELQAEIKGLEALISQRNEKLAEQARSVQTQGHTMNFIQFVLEAENLTDVVHRVDMVSEIVKANQILVEEQNRDKEAVVQKKNKTEDAIKKQAESIVALEVTQNDLHAQQLEKEVLVAQLASESATIASERQAFLAQKEAAEVAVAQFASAQATQTQAVAEAAGTVAQVAQSTPYSQGAAKQTAAAKKAPAPAPAASGNVLGAAAQYLGSPYYYGGTTPGGFDCSGYVQYVFRQIGKNIPRTTGTQYQAATPVSNPQPGDLVFFSEGGGSITHVGIYTGGGSFIGSQTSTGVAYDSVSSVYWGPRLVGYGRI